MAQNKEFRSEDPQNRHARRKPLSERQKAILRQQRAAEEAKTNKRKSKKKIAFGMAVALILSVGVYVATSNKNVKSSKAAMGSAYIDDDFVVVIDAGHGGFDVGTSGAFTGIEEKGINLTIAKYLKQELEVMGCKVIMTRTDEEAIGENKEADMQKREEVMAGPYVDLIISVHQNFFEGSSEVFGPQVFYKTANTVHEEFAKIIQDTLNDELAIVEPRRRHTAHDYRLLKYAQPPAVIVECGFLSNKEEERLLSTSEYQKKVAKAIAIGVKTYMTQNNLII